MSESAWRYALAGGSRAINQSPQRGSFPQDSSSRPVRLVARLLCAVTFPVVGLGGLVTTTKAGMAVPDWPNTYGYNLFLYPWQTWLWGPWDLFVEHGHRLAASASGLIAVVLAMLLWRGRRQQRWLAWMGIVTLIAVIVQGVLGGMRVVLDERWLAMIHGVIGPAYFGLTVCLVIWTSRWWHEQREVGTPSTIDLRAAGLLLVSVTATQMVLGAVLRHLPPEYSPQTFLAIAQFHLLFAAIVTGVWIAIALWARRHRSAATGWAIRTAGGMLLGQVLLGLATWCYKYAVPTWVEERTGWTFGTIVADSWWQSITVTAHQANGSLLLATCLWLLLVAWRTAPANVMVPVPSTTQRSGPLRRAPA